ncbi:MAG: hypothetical protein ALECFALPRED_011042 [Alectoria fallacina]|uniref:Yeast cell wall synthesis Kre9/Knh1-like N-terminal domain-containing protein n=1 Tax=Alectoria fallacina TaxID=1903189 RepID=A0A8H3IKL6_9LECA|nr:MAG: hypothetical protein ALECFALPRED_011042 [Alectoria fallacina]
MFSSMARLSVLAATLLLPIYVHAVAFSVNSFEGIAVGQPFNLSWLGDKTPVTIKLLQGPPEALEPVVTLASNVAGESYTWTPTTIPDGTYVLSITQGTQTNYSPEFPVANTFTPGTKSSTKATVEGATSGATGRDPLPAVIAAYYPPAGHKNGNIRICAFNTSGNGTSAAFPCASSVNLTLGHFQRFKGGVGKVDVATGAAVLGMTFAVMLML